MVNISIGVAGLTAVLGYAVVFLGIVFLMLVISIMGSIMKNRKAVPAVSGAPVSSAPNTKQIIANEYELLSRFGELSVPEGADHDKITAILAAVAEMEKEG